VTRGRQPLKAREKAFTLAEKRGLVQRFQHRRGNTSDFTIMSPGLISFVTVKRLDRLTVTPEDILHDFAVAIDLLRFIASGPGISRELWLRTPHGAWRFFRILENGIIELDPEGRVLVNISPAVLPAAVAGAGKKAVKVPGAKKKSGKSGKGEVGKNPEPMKNPEAYLTTAKESETKKDPQSSVITEKYAKPAENTEPMKNTEPEKDPGPAADSVPDSIQPKMPEQKKDLAHMIIPEKSVVPLQDPGPAADPAQLSEPEKVPEVIQKFLKRRKKGLEKDPELE
jgi:hypothetical protein